MSETLRGVMQPTHIATSLALATVVLFNWFLAHLATDWVLPPEVTQALQTIVTYAWVCVGLLWKHYTGIDIPEVEAQAKKE